MIKGITKFPRDSKETETAIFGYSKP